MKVWPVRSSRSANVEHMPLVDPQKVFFPPLHIKLGFMKNSAEAVNKNGVSYVVLVRSWVRSKSKQARQQEENTDNVI